MTAGVVRVADAWQVWVDIKFAGAVYNSEQFNTAGRSIGTGLLAVDIVSHWTWASILLQSVSYGYFYGITGSYWWGKQPGVLAPITLSLLNQYHKCIHAAEGLVLSIE